MPKGTRREREAVDLWQRAGYATYRPATVQYGENDIFGLFDLLAVKPNEPAVHAVQVKSNRAHGIQSWKRHTALWRRLGWKTLYAVPVDRAGWEIYDAGIEPHDKRRAARKVVDEARSHRDMGERVVEWLR